MTTHSLIAPSGAGTWSECTGWVIMTQQYPETTRSEDAREGDAAHEVAARMIDSASRGAVDLPARTAIVGSTASNGVVISEELYESAETYASSCVATMRERSVFAGQWVGIEQHVEAPRVHPLSHGTIDFFLYDRRGNELFIRDFKNGHAVVEVFENKQLINYAAALLDLFGIDGHADQSLRITFAIVQPRAYHRDGPVRTWSCMASDLRGLINQLSWRAAEALGPAAQCKSGAHCKDCPARHACPAAIAAGMGLYEVCARPVTDELSSDALGLQYSIVTRCRKALELVETGYAQQIESTLRSGGSVPGYALVEGRGKEAWKVPTVDLENLGRMLGVPLTKPKPITPNQARKAGVDPAIVEAYADRPRTGMQLAPANINRARSVFA